MRSTTAGDWVQRVLVLLAVCIFVGWALTPYLSELWGAYRGPEAVGDGGVGVRP